MTSLYWNVYVKDLDHLKKAFSNLNCNLLSEQAGFNAGNQNVLLKLLKGFLKIVKIEYALNLYCYQQCIHSTLLRNVFVLSTWTSQCVTLNADQHIVDLE